MKRINLLLLLIMPLLIMAQQYPITSINISLPQNPDASTNKWTTSASMLNITAMTKMVNGKIDPSVDGSKVMVSIKKAGSIVCGSVNMSSAPQANFNSSSKVWSGNAAVALLGQDCTLQPGQYEICVQFFGGPRNAAFSEQKCKAFTIRGVEQQSFQAPQLLTPTNSSSIKVNNINPPLTFRWTPVIPRPQEPTTYNLKVWQLMEGQNSTQAITANNPIIDTKIENLTQTLVNRYDIAPCKNGSCGNFVWNVQALNRDGKPIGGNNGTSEIFTFSFKKDKIEGSIVLKAPANNATLQMRTPVQFRWMASNSESGANYYKIKIVEILGDQSPAAAIGGNKPHFEKDSIQFIGGNKPHFEKDSSLEIIYNYSTNAPKLQEGKKYAWKVEAKGKDGKGGRESEVWVFKFIDITDPSTGCFKLDTNKYKVICNGYDPQGKPKYKISDLILTNIGTNKGKTGLHNTAATNYITPIGFTVVNLSPTSSISILPNSSINISFEINGATGSTASFIVNSTIIDPTNPNLYCDKTIGVTVDLPNCACNPCKEKQTTFGKDSSNSNNVGQVNMFSTVSHGPNKVIKVSAQIVNFERLGENGCLRCTKDSKEFGNFIGGSLNGNGGNILKGSYGKQIQWQFNTPTSLNGFNYNLNMMFPPLTDVSCCKDSIRICTRWSFTDDKCITCDTLICSVVKREYKVSTGPRLSNSNSFTSQIIKMGEPYIGWYNQKGTELPKNFDEQVNKMYESILNENKQVLENKPSKENYYANLVSVFNNIQEMKKTGKDAVWNTINSSPLNSQCDNGNFESGELDMTQWGGAYGTIPYISNNSAGSTNDIFTRGVYTNGFSPNPVSLDVPISNITNRHSVVTYADDPIVGSLLKTTSSISNRFSFRLGNKNIGYGTEILSKKFVVTGNGIIRFNYALVLDEPGLISDPSFTKSAFRVAVYDVNGNKINNKVYLDAANISPIDYIPSDATSPFFQIYLNGGSRIVYRDWSCAKIDLSEYIGQQISVALITNDCSWGGHYGYAYIDDWCGDCNGASTGSVNIKPIAESCIQKSPQVCVDYTLPKIGITTGTGTIKLEFYQNGILVPSATLTSPNLSSGSTYCFTINPARLPCNERGYDIVATGNFTVGSTPITVTSPDPIGSPVVGIVAGQNNDLYCCTTPAEVCCQNFIKTVTASVSMVGNSTIGYNSIKFNPSFVVGPKPIKQVRISVVNFETSSKNKECLTCESNTGKYGTISVPQNITGGSKDAIEGMIYPTYPIIFANCIGCPPIWSNRLSSEVTWGSQSGAGYDLTAGSGGDQSTTFNIALPKQSTLSCCDDTIKVCIKYSFTDIDCKTCDTIICYKIINRSSITTTVKIKSIGLFGDSSLNSIVKINNSEYQNNIGLGDDKIIKYISILNEKTYNTKVNPISALHLSMRWGSEFLNLKKYYIR